ncbi:3-ketosteroid-delta-1-dehydrogenase [Pimelobacter simplex]|uniref:3-ketosteroid-delta-1-dehydrogenase n=1 Tax=Nocardioides simplex TaxID=2045 RepID=UPI00380A5F59
MSDTTVDLLVIGSGTGLAAALSAREQGLDVLVVEKTEYVGGSTARSGGAFWIPANPALTEAGSRDTLERGETYLEAVVGDDAPKARWQAFLRHGPETIRMLRRTTSLQLMWARGYSDYHPELPGGDAAGRSIESKPFDASVLGESRALLRPGVVEAPVPMPVTGADYKWMNLVARKPGKGLPRVLRRAAQGIGGMVVGRDYLAGGQALAAGLFDGALRAGIPIWRETTLVELVTEGDRVVGAVLERDGGRVTVTARRGVVLAAGGFDHDMDMRHRYQAEFLANWSLGNEGNTGDAIKLAAEVGAELTLMDQTWWFPAVAPLPGGTPQVLLAERSLPGSIMVDGHGRRFINESTDYMTFGQTVLGRDRAGDPVGSMWLVFDQSYRNSYVLAGSLFPRMALPQEWYDAGIAHRAGTAAELARAAGLPEDAFTATLRRFNTMAAAGIDDDFHRGNSAYDRYYGDPTVTPNPNLRPLDRGDLHAVQVVLSDLGTCGGLSADELGRPLRADGSPIEGLYAIGNTAGNVFGRSYPGAGATIGQGLVFGHIVATHAATA